MQEYVSVKERAEGLEAYVSPFGALALSVGTAIGWGSFLFTSTLFLEKAGPAGSVLGMLVGMVIMLVIGRNYHYLMNEYPHAGGVYSYVKEVLDYDKAFLSFWYVSLAYLAMLWANATSVPLFVHAFFGNVLQVGYLYTVFNYKIFAGEALVTMALIMLTGWLCMKRERLAVKLVIALVAILTASIAICFGAAMLGVSASAEPVRPLFIPDQSIFSQILAVSLITPWAFIGFENISHSTREFKFNRARSFWILAGSVVLTTLLYIFMLLLSVSAHPPQFDSWFEYLRYQNGHGGSAEVPFFAAGRYLGTTGTALLACALFALIVTSLIGNTVALSRLFYQVAKDKVIPDSFSRLNSRKNPEKAILLIVVLSVGIPFLGRTAVSWIVDVLTIAAVIVYALVSATAYRLAVRQGRRLERVTGAVGMGLMAVLAVLQFFPDLAGDDTLGPETYFLLAIWSFSGFLFLRNVLQRDHARKFGRSVGAWVVLLGLTAFVAMSWMRHTNQDISDQLMNELRAYYRAEAPAEVYSMSEDEYYQKLYAVGEKVRRRNNSLVLLLIVFSIGMFFTNYSIVRRRESELEKELSSTLTMAYQDSLTGAKSKQAYVNAMKKIQQRIREGTQPQFALVVCDVNDLKYVNDTYGHKMGDAYICDAKELIARHFAGSPVYRIGGDEFVVVIEGRGYATRLKAIEELNREVERNVAGEAMVVVAAGLSDYRPARDKDFQDVFEHADILMYERKKFLKRMKTQARA